jgi:hypothetical protein
MSAILETIGIATGVVGVGVAIKEYFDKRSEKKVVVETPETEELSRSEQHAKMHELISNHREVIGRIKENHQLLAQLKNTPRMGRQKSYVWDEIEADRRVADRIADEIKQFKVALFGDKAVNLK